jgi:hypothetical protein
VVFKSTSRDPFRPSLEYADPKSSGGLIIDMGIHDFDLARWFMGEVASVRQSAACSPTRSSRRSGDIDNAMVTPRVHERPLGVIDITRNGTTATTSPPSCSARKGTLRVGYLRETPMLVMTKNAVTHDTVPYFMERFRDAYTVQLENFAENVLRDRPPPVTVDGWGGGAARRGGGDARAADRRPGGGGLDRRGAGRMTRGRTGRLKAAPSRASDFGLRGLELPTSGFGSGPIASESSCGTRHFCCARAGCRAASRGCRWR